LFVSVPGWWGAWPRILNLPIRRNDARDVRPRPEATSPGRPDQRMPRRTAGHIGRDLSFLGEGLTPLVNIAEDIDPHVIVWIQESDRGGCVFAFLPIPRVVSAHFWIAAERVQCLSMGETRIDPLGLGRESVARVVEVVARQFHSRTDLVDGRIAE